MKIQAKATELPRGAGLRCGIVSARFYTELANWLEDGARRALRECGVAPEAIVECIVPGCFELPLAAQRLISAQKLDAVVALGVVVRGDTPHFDYVAGECSRGLMDVCLRMNVPVGFGVLTTNTLEQAAERADPKRGDKGHEAALAALRLAQLPR